MFWSVGTQPFTQGREYILICSFIHALIHKYVLKAYCSC